MVLGFFLVPQRDEANVALVLARLEHFEGLGVLHFAQVLEEEFLQGKIREEAHVLLAFVKIVKKKLGQCHFGLGSLDLFDRNALGMEHQVALRRTNTQKRLLVLVIRLHWKWGDHHLVHLLGRQLGRHALLKHHVPRILREVHPIGTHIAWVPRKIGWMRLVRLEHRHVWVVLPI